MKLEWDANKRRTNIAKHGIDFDDVAAVFVDPKAHDAPSKGEHGEPRRVRIGQLVGHIITVVYTKRGDILRIISARVARKAERALHGKRSD